MQSPASLATQKFHGERVEARQREHTLPSAQSDVVKAQVAPCYDGHPTWHGCFRALPSHYWGKVHNGAGLPTAYASEAAAITGARLARQDVLDQDQKQFG